MRHCLRSPSAACPLIARQMGLSASSREAVNSRNSMFFSLDERASRFQDDTGNDSCLSPLSGCPAGQDHTLAEPAWLESARPELVLPGRGVPGTVNDVQRSVPFEILLPIISENTEWYSLQKHVRERDREALSATPAMINRTETFTDFSDTAAIIAELDRRTFRSIASYPMLAGAIGKPVWMLLAYHADFRYLRDRENNPSYPTARLFRQRTEGDWASVLDRLQPELNEFLA